MIAAQKGIDAGGFLDTPHGVGRPMAFGAAQKTPHSAALNAVPSSARTAWCVNWAVAVWAWSGWRSVPMAW